MIIYQTTNKINGIIYVGRYSGNNKKYLGSGTDFKIAVKKYGEENFTRKTLEDGITDHNYLCEREIYWIKKLNATNPKTGYNIAKGGEGQSVGYTHSEETRNRMRDAWVIRKKNMIYLNPIFDDIPPVSEKRAIEIYAHLTGKKASRR